MFIGVQEARGDFVATLDQDDAFAPTKLHDQIGLLKLGARIGLVFGDVTLHGPDRELNDKISRWFRGTLDTIPKAAIEGGFVIRANDAIAAIIRHRCFAMTCSNMLFPVHAWRAAGGFDERLTVSCDLGFLAAVARRFDIGYVPSPSATWLLHPHSFYRTASERARVRDLLRVFATIPRNLLTRSERGELYRAARELALDEAFRLRESGHHIGALATLWRGMRIAGPWPAAIAALAKLLPHRLVRATRLLRSKSGSEMVPRRAPVEAGK